jgi:hypothetical protein
LERRRFDQPAAWPTAPHTAMGSGTGIGWRRLVVGVEAGCFLVINLADGVGRAAAGFLFVIIVARGRPLGRRRRGSSTSSEHQSASITGCCCWGQPAAVVVVGAPRQKKTLDGLGNGAGGGEDDDGEKATLIVTVDDRAPSAQALAGIPRGVEAPSAQEEGPPQLKR